MKALTDFKDQVLNDPENKKYPTLNELTCKMSDFVQAIDQINAKADQAVQAIQTETDHLECFIDCLKAHPATKEYFLMMVNRINSALEKLA